MDWERNVEFCVVDVTFGKTGSGDEWYIIYINTKQNDLQSRLLEANGLYSMDNRNSAKMKKMTGK